MSSLDGPQKMESVRVSEASRRDARSAPDVKWESFQDEFEWLLAEKKRIESQLSLFNKAAMAKAQLDIRKKYANNHEKSIGEWMRTKIGLEGERSILVNRKNEIELRIMEIRARVKAEKKSERSKELNWTDAAMELKDAIDLLTNEMRLLRATMESRNKKDDD